MKLTRTALFAIVAVFSVGCVGEQTEALGTLEWDRVNGRAIVSEPIVALLVKEGDRVEQGQPLVQLDSRLQEAQVKRLQALVQQAEWQLKQREAGYRREEIASAQAEAEAAKFNRETRAIEFNREKELFDKKATSERRLDLSANALASAKAQEQSAIENQKMLESGYRVEEVERAKANLAAAQAELQYAMKQLEQYTVKAERAGLLDSLPFKLGDRPPVGAVVSTVLAGDQPYARIYLPQPWLSQIQAGDTVDIFVDGATAAIPGTIRYIASNASFTPYYTLSEEDRSRLSYVTEIDLEAGANDLPLGIPVRMQLRD